MNEEQQLMWNTLSVRADKLMAHAGVRHAYEQFLLVCKEAFRELDDMSREQKGVEAAPAQPRQPVGAVQPSGTPTTLKNNER